MQAKPYYRCADGCRNCPRRQQCLRAAAAVGPAEVPSAASPDTVAREPQFPPTSPEEAASSAMAEYLKKNPGQGTLRVQAFRSRQVIPVPGVQIRITGRVGGEDVVFFEGVTDESGIADAISLPAPARALSMTPEDPVPYAIYELYAEHPDYRPLRAAVQIFQGVKTVQPIQLQLKEV